MKSTFVAKMMNELGFTLTELVIVVAIITTLFAIATIAGKQYMDKYSAEEQMRLMHADLLQARVNAMEKNKLYFVQLNNSSYTIVEDTNENGILDPPPADTVVAQQTLKFPVSSILPSTLTMPLVIDQRGLLSLPTCSASILFSTGSASPEYDCFELYPTRINLGKWNGGSCVPK